MPSERKVVLRPLEREDLHFVHQMDNNANVMRYWFEEPYETFVELVEIDHVHRRAEFQIVIAPDHQGKGLARCAAELAYAHRPVMGLRDGPMTRGTCEEDT